MGGRARARGAALPLLRARGWQMIKKIRIVVFFILFAAIMAGLYVGCPTLFTVDLAKPHYVEANNLELTRVYSRAIPKYEMVIREYPDSQYVSYSQLGIANCYRRLGESEKAIGLYDGLISKYGSNEKSSSVVRDAMNNKAETYRDLGQTEKAVAAFQTLVDRYPGTDSALQASIYVSSAGRKADSGTAVAEAQNVKRVLEVVRLETPAQMRKGEEATMQLELKSIVDKVLYDVTIQTDLAYWGGLQVISVQPNPISVQEFWGTRRWVYKELPAGETLKVAVVVRAAEAGTFDSAFKIEASMEDAGISEHFSTRIEE
jgi:tetratricopeptide (TPR) repeat protein